LLPRCRPAGTILQNTNAELSIYCIDGRKIKQLNKGQSRYTQIQ